jgi:branched-chain amino acid transport system permease protein
MSALLARAPWLRSSAWWGVAGFALFMAALPLLFGTPYALSTLVLIGIYTIVTIGLCILMGYAGQISLGQAAFFGLGAYASAVLTTRLGWSPWVAMAAAAAGTGLVAQAIGTPVFRLRGHYLAMGTLAFGALVHIVMTEWKDVTGGPTGLPGIPRLAVGSFVLSGDRAYYYLVWGAAIVALAIALNLVNSRVGRALRAIRDSEPAAESLGVDVARYKTLALVISAVYASLAGSLYAHYMIFVNPTAFDFGVSVRLVLMAAVGGMGTIWGAPAGTAAVMLLALVLREALPLITGPAAGEYEMIAYGVLLVVIMIFVPQGLTPAAVEAVRQRGLAESGSGMRTRIARILRTTRKETG